MPKPVLGRHRGSFVVTFYDESGKRHRHSLGTADRKEAERRLAHYELSNTILDKSVQKTVEGIYHLYLDYLRSEGKPTQRIEFGFRQLQPVFGHLFPQYVTPELVREYTKERKASRGTVHLELNFLRTILRWGYRNQYVPKEIFIKLPPKAPPKADYISKEQFHSLLSGTTYPHLHLFMVLAVSTGARSNALLDLTWDRVDLSRRLIDLRNLEKHETAKGRAVVPITDAAHKYLLSARKGAQTRYVIEYAGSPVKHIRYAMERISERAGIKVTAHMFRHSAAVWMAEGGVPMSEIAQFLGHSNTAITERIYARYSPDYLRNAARHLEV
jgi:integrase